MSKLKREKLFLVKNNFKSCYGNENLKLYGKIMKSVLTGENHQTEFNKLNWIHLYYKSVLYQFIFNEEHS